MLVSALRIEAVITMLSAAARSARGGIVEPTGTFAFITKRRSSFFDFALYSTWPRASVSTPAAALRRASGFGSREPALEEDDEERDEVERDEEVDREEEDPALDDDPPDETLPAELEEPLLSSSPSFANAGVIEVAKSKARVKATVFILLIFIFVLLI
jgi:hypothetical protein